MIAAAKNEDINEDNESELSLFYFIMHMLLLVVGLEFTESCMVGLAYAF